MEQFLEIHSLLEPKEVFAMHIAIRCIAVLLIVIVTSGCAANSPQQGSGGAVTTEPLESMNPVEASVMKQFPSSQDAPKGKSWQTMREDGFTGSWKEACALLQLTDTQCSTYQSMHERGVCEIMNVPNGVVLDGLTYTREQKHRVQEDVAVALENPSTRQTEVCDLGDGVYAMRFLGCNNHAVVRRFFASEPSAPMSKKAEEACPRVVQAPAHTGKFVVFVKDEAIRKCLEQSGGRYCKDCTDWLRGLRGYVSTPARGMKYALIFDKEVQTLHLPAEQYAASYCDWGWNDPYASKWWIKE